jgi:hypothetical protein
LAQDEIERLKAIRANKLKEADEWKKTQILKYRKSVWCKLFHKNKSDGEIWKIMKDGKSVFSHDWTYFRLSCYNEPFDSEIELKNMIKMAEESIDGEMWVTSQGIKLL